MGNHAKTLAAPLERQRAET